MIRPAGAQDLPFLRDMLRHAYYARWGSEADVPLERYVAGWGRPGDNAVVASSSRSARRGIGCSRRTNQGTDSSTSRRRN